MKVPGSLFLLGLLLLVLASYLNGLPEVHPRVRFTVAGLVPVC
jgi:hypothetical protein